PLYLHRHDPRRLPPAVEEGVEGCGYWVLGVGYWVLGVRAGIVLVLELALVLEGLRSRSRRHGRRALGVRIALLLARCALQRRRRRAPSGRRRRGRSVWPFGRREPAVGPSRS